MPASVEAETSPKRPKNVPKQARWWKGSWYHAFEGRPTWEVAKEKCESLGGHLAIIPDEETWAIVRRITLEGDYWLGATDAESEGSWKWVDGSPVTFTAWRGGEPNNLEEKEHYLSSPWADLPVSCPDWIKGYVCQWESFEFLITYRLGTESQNPAVAKALTSFRGEIAAAVADAHESAIKAADTLYQGVLTKEIDAATKRKETELALAMDNERERLRDGVTIPDYDEAVPPALTKLRKIHRAQCEKADDDRARKVAPIVRRYDLILEKIEAKAVREGGTAQAAEVKNLRKAMGGLAG